MDEQHQSLSPQGEHRREAMLSELVGSMARLHHRRSLRRRAVSAAALIAVAVGVFRLTTVDPGISRIAQTDISGEKPASEVLFVHTDPGASARYRAVPDPLIVRVDDAQLVRTLIEIGRPAGLIHIGERVALSAPVTDDELNLRN
jgi:hypothetical protein